MIRAVVPKASGVQSSRFSCGIVRKKDPVFFTTKHLISSGVGLCGKNGDFVLIVW